MKRQLGFLLAHVLLALWVMGQNKSLRMWLQHVLSPRWSHQPLPRLDCSHCQKKWENFLKDIERGMGAKDGSNTSSKTFSPAKEVDG